jgi:hypothetical protein
MNTRQNAKSGSSLAEQLSSIEMSLEQRTAVLRDAFIAELIADAIVSICGKVKQVGAGEFVRPNVYYWE